jgi:hypothetical protein
MPSSIQVLLISSCDWHTGAARAKWNISHGLRRLNGDSQGEAEANDLSSALPIAEPGRNRHHGNFRGIWAQIKSGTRFERKRLIRMTYQGGL